jgi:aryl-phospho-beta-D-glucosidase BglC (GH1 family)
MYIIINTHHEENVIKLTDEEHESSLHFLVRLWEQIAEEFKDYSEKLIFEGLNEMRNIGRNEWNGGTPEYRENLNKLQQAFVDTVRASGGNNAKRILMISTYAASSEAAAFNGFVMPEDIVPDKLALSVHTYTPNSFCFDGSRNTQTTWDADVAADTAHIHDNLSRVAERAREMGVPVILGEWGSVNKNNTEARAAHALYYASYARSLGMATVWWDDGGRFILLNRSTQKWIYPEIAEAILQGDASGR